ncbi:hypothetical protein CBR_g1156 [Chara braunii]|uniref:CCHC-type domain-containing protein n=1 Tax=Chara braunii TaxID=69332 RepID=A0A388KDF6_CHABU|nr:hypothetical protein CBR_g1156 [Chara braunii]|eukprot:GBG68036.1 hypothetical protein CBR_g1156 [Chara braunii]
MGPQNGYRQGVVTCHICGKAGHYARNCWSAGNGRTPYQSGGQGDEETKEMKEYFHEKIKKRKINEERRMREEEERKRRYEENRREIERIKEAEAREARLEARMVRLLNQHTRSNQKVEEVAGKKKSPKTKARMLREIRSYLVESDDDSEEVREEAGKLIEAIEKRKGKKLGNEDGRVSKNGLKGYPVGIEDDDEVRTPPPIKKGQGDGTGGTEMLDFAIEMHWRLSEKKVPEQRKLCNKEGIEWSRKDNAIGELVRCKAKLAYEEFVESGKISPWFEK